MVDHVRHADRRRSHWVAAAQWALAITAASVAAAATVTGLIARSIIVPPKKREYDTHVLGFDQHTGVIEFSRSADASTPGRYSLWFNDERGLARVGAIIGETETTVTRELVGVEYGDLSRAAKARFAGWWFAHPRDLGLPYENVEVDTELGAAPAWLFTAEHDTGCWVIQVHGRASRRHEALRSVPVFRGEGWNSLLISYRNDGDAPYTADGRYALGDSEWSDVDAAMRFALDHGAKHLVLMGWSMGGATVLQAATRSPLAEHVRGVSLDSPVIDWVSTLNVIAGDMGLPWIARQLTFRAMGAPWGRILTGKREPINLARLDFVTRAGELDVPILIQHSDQDGYVPSEGSHALAGARPDIVTFESWSIARHTKLWNYDSDRWEKTIRQWLRSLNIHRA
ncbi:MAG TPA: prolyl oligopeptidase family serine peptidase [Terrimesophilobacter sp.]|nr:prolyl oligopeptidase family serine peptidase [Terrimesophilobacter sp.]